MDYLHVSAQHGETALLPLVSVTKNLPLEIELLLLDGIILLHLKISLIKMVYTQKPSSEMLTQHLQKRKSYPLSEKISDKLIFLFILWQHQDELCQMEPSILPF